MAKKRRKQKRMNLTEKYERRRLWAGYFGLDFKQLKRASRKALKAIEKAIKQKRLELKQQGVTDIPSVSQVAKYERQSKEQSQKEEQEREPLPYADEDIIPQINETEDIINSFMSTMEQALQEAIKAYGMSQPWRASTFEKQILQIMADFNEARALKGDEYIAKKIADSLDYERIVTLIAYDYNEASEALENLSDAFAGIINDMAS